MEPQWKSRSKVIWMSTRGASKSAIRVTVCFTDVIVRAQGKCGRNLGVSSGFPSEIMRGAPISLQGKNPRNGVGVGVGKLTKNGEIKRSLPADCWRPIGEHWKSLTSPLSPRTPALYNLRHRYVPMEHNFQTKTRWNKTKGTRRFLSPVSLPWTLYHRCSHPTPPPPPATANLYTVWPLWQQGIVLRDVVYLISPVCLE